MSSREKPSAVCVRSFVPNEKKSACSAMRSACRQARGSSIIVPTEEVLGMRRGPRARRRASTRSSEQLELALVVDERDHDLDLRPAAAAPAHRLERPAGRPGPASRRSRGAGSRGARRACRASGSSPGAPRRARALGRALGAGRPPGRREELVQRRVEQPDRHRQARPSPRQDRLEVALLERQELVERGAALPRRRRPG